MPRARTPEEVKEYHKKNLYTFLMKNAEQHGKGISESTATSYMYRIKRAFKLAFPDGTFKNKAFINKNPGKVIKAINESEMPLNSKASTYTALLSIYPVGNPSKKMNNGKTMYLKQLKKLSDEIKDNMETQVKSPKQTDRWVESEVIAQKRDEYFDSIAENGTYEDHLRFFTFALFTILPPRRAIDYGVMKINPGKDWDGNEMIVKDGKFERFIYRKYKLSKKKGIQEFDREFMNNLPNGDEILFLLDNWGSQNKEGFILGGEKSANLMSKTIKAISKRILGKYVNINILRHVYISDFLSSKEGQYYKEKDAVASYMGHSTSMQEFYKKREISEKDEKNSEK